MLQSIVFEKSRWIQSSLDTKDRFSEPLPQFMVTNIIWISQWTSELFYTINSRPCIAY